LLDIKQKGAIRVFVIIAICVLFAIYGTFAIFRDFVFHSSSHDDFYDSVTVPEDQIDRIKTPIRSNGEERSASKYHIIISTECSLYNEWQAYLFLCKLIFWSFLVDFVVFVKILIGKVDSCLMRKFQELFRAVIRRGNAMRLIILC
jgi:hypothetical protein